MDKKEKVPEAVYFGEGDEYIEVKENWYPETDQELRFNIKVLQGSELMTWGLIKTCNKYRGQFGFFSIKENSNISGDYSPKQIRKAIKKLTQFGYIESKPDRDNFWVKTPRLYIEKEMYLENMRRHLENIDKKPSISRTGIPVAQMAKELRMSEKELKQSMSKLIQIGLIDP